METTNKNNSDNKLDSKRARAWIITLALGTVILTGLIIYTFITRTPAFSFFDAPPFITELVWLGSIGIFLLLESFLFLMIASSTFRFFPESDRIFKITAIVGIVLMLLTFILLFVSFNLETYWMRYVGLIVELTGANMILFKNFIQQRFNKIAKIWSLVGTIIFFSGATLMVLSVESIEPKI